MTTTKKKDVKGKTPKENGKDVEVFGKISSSADLKAFLNLILDKMSDDVASPIYAVSAMNHVMNIGNIYDLLDSETKELARDIWLRLKASGMQLRNPPLLFGAEEALTNSQVIGK